MGPKPNPVLWVHPALTLTPGGFWRQDEPRPPQRVMWVLSPDPPARNAAGRGPEPPLALQMQPWQEVSGAAAAAVALAEANQRLPNSRLPF